MYVKSKWGIEDTTNQIVDLIGDKLQFYLLHCCCIVVVVGGGDVEIDTLSTLYDMYACFSSCFFSLLFGGRNCISGVVREEQKDFLAVGPRPIQQGFIVTHE